VIGLDPKVYIVGGHGYIGTRLVPCLIADGWAPEVIDCGIYEEPAPLLDVRKMNPPEDNHPVVWLATIHKEPDGLKQDEVKPWVQEMTKVMVDLPLAWYKAGHPMLYASSMQVVGPGPSSAYAYAKRIAEASFVGAHNTQVLRFGTVWGGLNENPLRLETAINAALLGEQLPDDYKAYTTHINRAVEALCYGLCRPFLGTVENVTDSDDYVTGAYVNDTQSKPPTSRTAWELLFSRESDRAEWAQQRRGSYRPATELLAQYYGLPWPSDSDSEPKENDDDSEHPEE
jgi:nucleoside-diphosphate-sugar epimerase